MTLPMLQLQMPRSEPFLATHMNGPVLIGDQPPEWDGYLLRQHRDLGLHKFADIP